MRLIILTSWHNWKLLVNSAAYFADKFPINSVEFACLGDSKLKDDVQASFTKFLESDESKNSTYVKLLDCQTTQFSCYDTEAFFRQLEKFKKKERKRILFAVDPLPKDATLRYVARLLGMDFVNIHTLNTSEVFRGLIHENKEVFSDENLYDVGYDFISFMERGKFREQAFVLVLALLSVVALVLVGPLFNESLAEMFLKSIGAFGGFLALYFSISYFWRYLKNR